MKKGATKRSKVPAALAKRDAAATAAKTARLRAEAKELLALVARRKRAISEAFYDIGEALTRLGAKEMLAVLGRRTFAELCEKDAGLSAATGQRLVAIVKSMGRDEALAMGSKKAMAMVSLAEATPEDDSAAGLWRKKTIALPGGRSVSPRTASANEIEAAATAIRHALAAKSPSTPRGRTTTAEERTLAALLERKLHNLGLARARVTAVATKPGQGADLRFEHIPAAQLDALKQAIGR